MWRAGTLLFVAAALAACQTHGLHPTYYAGQLELALRNGNELDRPYFVDEADWPATLDCMISAIVAEIPLSDQSVLVQGLNGGYYQGHNDDLYVKYFWSSPAHGEIMWPDTPDAPPSSDGRLRFRSGDLVPELDFDLRRHMRRNFEGLCPGLADKYPAILSLPPMEEV
ncbi:hypothetical protein [Dongia rigui]|uniref:Uncharacterized protein n=1 Tax=Dongia rigui TaxID=940149 RepID=A0ABU5E1T2_9PROT|nr:hypothetical protein [Dongia rigui]MDY0873521.1 hypothetical protein [Dongia rigui]